MFSSIYHFFCTFYYVQKTRMTERTFNCYLNENASLVLKKKKKEKDNTYPQNSSKNLIVSD